MANSIYPLYKQELMKHTANTELDSAEGATGVYVALVDTGTYTYSDTHQFYSDLSGIVGTDQEILNKTQTGRIFDGDNVTFPSVGGDSAEALAFYRRNAGANTTWRLIAYIDSGVGGLPVTPNTGDIQLAFDAQGIFGL
ncbi:hypothetical protein [uncultured Paraglaciecola sp.]|uniref:hypothetical protein n=1 Tax=uncultured Paraglaciecola sp. TaxID=1765024 RepID=UPI00262BAEEC|nr:hypothetical protein [uncultured Paraglaciecola sp.]